MADGTKSMFSIRWWKGLDMIRKLPFARDRCVECYFWIVGVYFELQYSLAREILTKVMLLTSVMDDIYDVYGTFDELQLLTDAIERQGKKKRMKIFTFSLSKLINPIKRFCCSRWDTRVMDQLPGYMQVFYKALLDLFDAIEEKLADMEGQCYRLFYAKEAVSLELSTQYPVAMKKYIVTEVTGKRFDLRWKLTFSHTDNDICIYQFVVGSKRHNHGYPMITFFFLSDENSS